MKLVYLGVRGLGEPLRMMARYTNYSFAEDVTIPGPEFRVMKMNEKAVHSRSEQLPSLHVASDTKSAAPLVISQSGACMRYLAGITGHTPVSLEQRARADAVFDTAQELFAVNPLANVFPVGAERDAKEKEYFSMAFRRRLRFCERLLDEAKAETGATTAFFGGREPYYGTVCVCVFLCPCGVENRPRHHHRDEDEAIRERDMRTLYTARQGNNTRSVCLYVV